MASSKGKFYPNCDESVWLRSCEEEIIKPIHGTVTGNIPAWLCGSLLRNGPGSLKVGTSQYEHLFDSSALLHRFAITEGAVTYQCRFVQTERSRKNRAANRIVISEFGTKAVPDPCHTIFDSISALFNPGEHMSDNTMISVYPFGDEMYAFSETPVIYRIDPATLDTCEKKNLTDSVALVNHTSHPHIMNNGDVYNVGMSVVKGRLKHVIVKFPCVEKGDMFETAHVVGSVNPRWPLHPAYMHTFGITENYFVILEQPLSISLPATFKNQITNEPLISSLQWYPEHDTHIVLINRRTGAEERRFATDALFYLHIINAFERGAQLVVDVCAYKDPRVINAMYIKAIENMHNNAEYADWFRARPQRLTVSLQAPQGTRVDVTQLADIGCETPRIHYQLYNGLPYRYFYAISSDVDADNPGTLIKVDTSTGQTKTWCEFNCYPSEPVFVPSPEATEEDDGILLSSLVWGGADTCRAGLLVLRARDLAEMARAVFHTPSEVPKCLHGWFTHAHPDPKAHSTT